MENTRSDISMNISEREAAAIRLAESKESPMAAAELNANGDWKDRIHRPSARKTDCPEGCSVNLNGACPHGWRSAARTLYMEEFRARTSV